MGQTYFFARNTHTGKTQPFPLQMFIIIPEQLFQQFLSFYTSHDCTSYLFVMSQTTYPSESRK